MLITLKLVLRTLVLPPAGPLLLAGLGTWLLVRGRTGAALRRAALALLVVMLVNHRFYNELPRSDLEDKAVIDTRGVWS